MTDEASLFANDTTMEESLDDMPALSCPACGADLVDDERFHLFRTCADCGRHFSIPARERIGVLVDDGSFREIPLRTPLEERLELNQASAADRLAEMQERSVLDEAIVIGRASIGGAPSVVIALDDHLLGAHIGALGAEKIIVGMEHALSQRLPLVALVAGGAARTQAGPLAMVQGARLAATAAQLQVAGVPMIAVLAHPTSAEIFSSFASQCDLIFAEPGTQVGVAWSTGQSLEAVEQAMFDDAMLANGWIDGVVARHDLPAHLGSLLQMFVQRGRALVPGDAPQARAAEGHDTVAASDPARPTAPAYLDRLVTGMIEMRGDRVDADDRQVRCGIGRLGELVVAVVAQDRNVDGAGRSVAALRKVQRLARLAGRFEIPLVLLVDAPRKQGPVLIRPDEALALAKLNSMLAMLPVPVVSVAVGRVAGVLANVMMTGDRRLMQEQATYHLAGTLMSRGGRMPTPPAGIEPGSEWPARECERLGVIDDVIPEPQGGAAADPGWAAGSVRAAASRAMADLAAVGPRRLVETRQRRHRAMGHETEEGLAAIQLELREWQEVQQSVARSFEELRERFGQRMAQQPRLSFQRPDLGELAARLRARREEIRQDLLERTGRGDRS